MNQSRLSKSIKLSFLVLFMVLMALFAMHIPSRAVTKNAASNTHQVSLPIVMKNAPVASGSVNFYKKLTPGIFDPCNKTPTPQEWEWIHAHYWRMLAYAPCFDKFTSEYKDVWAYKDLYAIYTNGKDDEIISQHPEWILRDADGNELYIDWGCSGGTCPQYAGDFGNPAFRAHWIAAAAAVLSEGYAGLWIDDVNLDWRISDGDGNFVNPVDPRTGTAMTLEDWRRYFAEFTEQIRAAFPGVEIAHNAIWYAGPTDNPYILRELQAADYINLERGINDSGLKGGSSTYGLETLLAYIDFIHSLDRNILFLAYEPSEKGREYGLVGWLLISNGHDGFSNDYASSPNDWWPGYGVDLGLANGARYSWGDVLRRDFERGLVLLNQPDMPTRVINLPGTYLTVDGDAVSSVTLAASEGVILLEP